MWNWIDILTSYAAESGKLSVHKVVNICTASGVYSMSAMQNWQKGRCYCHYLYKSFQLFLSLCQLTPICPSVRRQDRNGELSGIQCGTIFGSVFKKKNSLSLFFLGKNYISHRFCWVVTGKWLSNSAIITSPVGVKLLFLTNIFRKEILLRLFRLAHHLLRFRINFGLNKSRSFLISNFIL